MIRSTIVSQIVASLAFPIYCTSLWVQTENWNLINIRHVRLLDVLNELAITHGDGTLQKVVKDYQKIGSLILDEFLLSTVYTEQTKKLLKIIEAHSVKGSVIFCTQFGEYSIFSMHWDIGILSRLLHLVHI